MLGYTIFTFFSKTWRYDLACSVLQRINKHTQANRPIASAKKLTTSGWFYSSKGRLPHLKVCGKPEANHAYNTHKYWNSFIFRVITIKCHCSVNKNAVPVRYSIIGLICIENTHYFVYSLIYIYVCKFVQHEFIVVNVLNM